MNRTLSLLALSALLAGPTLLTAGEAAQLSSQTASQLAAQPAAQLFAGIAGLSLDPGNGRLYLLDKKRSAIFRIEPGGAPTLFAGGAGAGFNGDGPALETQFRVPTAFSVDLRTDELFVADTYNYRVRVISPDGRVTTVAGVGLRGVAPEETPPDFPTVERVARGHFSGEGGPATDAELNLPSGVAADPIGILFIADSGNHRVRAVNRGTSPVFLMGVEIDAGAIVTIAGTGELGFSGDGGKAAEARLAYPAELQVDASGNLFVHDTLNQCIRKIDRQSGVIHTIARGELAGIDPYEALLHWSTSIAGLAVATTQEVLWVDRVTGSIHSVSRGGEDSVVFTMKPKEPVLGSVAIGPRGEIYTADLFDNRVLRVEGGAAQIYVQGAPGGIRPRFPIPPRPAAKPSSR